MMFGEIPSTYGPARREIIQMYVDLRRSGQVFTVRAVAERLHRPLDSNNSHSFIRHVIKEYTVLLTGNG